MESIRQSENALQTAPVKRFAILPNVSSSPLVPSAMRSMDAAADQRLSPMDRNSPVMFAGMDVNQPLMFASPGSSVRLVRPPMVLPHLRTGRQSSSLQALSSPVGVVIGV